MDPSFDRLYQQFHAVGQGHVFRFWPQLGVGEQSALLAQLARVDLGLLDRLAHGEGTVTAGQSHPSRRPAPVLRLRDAPTFTTRARAKSRGEDLLRRGEVGVFLVAGGQGSRLGVDGPKGCLSVGVLSGRSLYEIHALKVARLREVYGAPIPLYVMTSPSTHAATQAYFAEHDRFGLPDADLMFLPQSTLPTLDLAGKLVLEAPGRLLESPNGHGGAYEAFAHGGGLDDARRRGLRHVFYFQVDNPLVRVADPLFVGFHDLAGAELSLKVLEKTGPDEKLGVVVIEDGRARVVEYSDLSPSESAARNADGTLTYWAGSIAIHIFSLGLLERAASGAMPLSYHVARKQLRVFTGDQALAEIDGLKFETFIFDVLPQTLCHLHVETRREEEFAPIKQLHGVDSLDSARGLLVAEHRRWLARAGIDARGPVEVSPAVAAGADDLAAALAGQHHRVLEGGARVERDALGKVRVESI